MFGFSQRCNKFLKMKSIFVEFHININVEKENNMKITVKHR